MKNSSTKLRRNHIKSFTSLFDIFAPKPFQDVYHLHSQKEKNDQATTKAPCNSSTRSVIKNEFTKCKTTPYVTSENYNALNKKSSDKSVVRSTSTLFYDLDKLIKRHSYHCVTQVKVLNNNTHLSDNPNKNCFGGKSETIVQKCATQIQPHLKHNEKVQKTDKKGKKNRINHPKFSSEICLNDNCEYDENHFVKYEDNHNQKFWSYAKYQTEYTKPIPKEKKCKKKDRGKRTEDPCPCQLFSYACPCTNTKSLTELAKNSKCLTVADQITSTTKFMPDSMKENKNSITKNSKFDQNYDNKLVNTENSEVTKKSEVTPVSEEAVAQIINARLVPKPTKESSIRINGTKVKLKSQQKLKQLFCPKCKEKLEIISFTEEDDYVKAKNSPFDPKNDFKESFNIKEDNDICNHNPPCELVPVCQILPNDTYVNTKCVENVSTVKHNPKMIRITKACRHHPPCTVVPSCQRLNVLKNNCEYIPPCLHRPRCVNLPLCVPISKNFYYDDVLNKQTEEVDIHDYSPQYKYQQDSINSTADHQFHATQKTCEYFSEYSPRLVLNPKMPCISPTFSPYLPPPISCKCCMTNKSCQYDCVDCKCIPDSDAKEKESVDAVIYIRDVGCQFRYKSFSPQDSLLYSKTSSTSFNVNSINKTGKYYGKFHTLRYEDKYTNPISGEELSMSTFTTSSLEIDVHCPSHGRQTGRGYTDFSPKSTASPFVAAFTTYTDDLLPYCLSISKKTSKASNKSEQNNASAQRTVRVAKLQKSFMKGKRKKVFAVKRHKKSRLESKTRFGCLSSS